MIRKGKWKAALMALNSVLVTARYMAYQRRDHDDLAKVLDAAEYLPLLIVSPNDETDHFRGIIAELVDIDVGFQRAVDKFDDVSVGQ